MQTRKGKLSGLIEQLAISFTTDPELFADLSEYE